MTATMLTMRAELAGPAELAQVFGVSRTRVQQITAKADFPAPIAELVMGNVWDMADVRRWAKTTGRELHELAPRPAR